MNWAAVDPGPRGVPCHRAARAHRQRHLRCGQLDRDGRTARGSGGRDSRRSAVIDLGGGNRSARAAGSRRKSTWRSWIAESPNSRSGFRTSSFGWRPGRFLVGQGRACWVAVVTQLKGQGATFSTWGHRHRHEFLDQARRSTGAHHDIRNLNAPRGPHEPSGSTWSVRICETADQLGSDRWLPANPGRRRTAHREPAAPTAMPWPRIIICVLPRLSL